MRILLCLFCCLNVLYSSVQAQTFPASSQETGRILQTLPLEGDIRIDGQLDESDWQRVQPATDFFQAEPIERGKPTYKTEVRILYGTSALYIGAMLYDHEPDKIYRPLGRRDEQLTSDWFTFAVDSYFDKKTAYIFTVNPANVQGDGIFTEGGTGGGPNSRGDMDRSWDAVWDSETRITPKGWSVEMRIPYSMLRFSNSAEQVWGINFRRTIGRLSEVNSWIFVPRSERSVISKYGQLVGLKNIKPRRNLQVTPYALAQYSNYEDLDLEEVVTDKGVKVGADLKIGLSTNSTLDLSLNPDFGQVESDPAELNLTTFETVLQEKRPFFTEGSQIFDYIFGGMEGGMLYTRRIGAANPIIGAAKLSGRTNDGFSYGVIGALTGEDYDPARIYAASRFKKEFGAFSRIGGGLTFFENRFAGEERRSMAGGIDWDWRFKNNTYQFNGHTTFTRANDIWDDNNQSNGFITATRLFKIQGVTQWGSGVEVYSPDADPSDVGRLREQDYIEWFGNFRRFFNDNKPFGPFQRGQFMSFFWNRWSYSQPVYLGFGWFGNAFFQTKNFRNLFIGTDVDEISGYNIRETRDLEHAIKLPSTFNFNIGGSSDQRKHYVIRPQVRMSFQQGGGRSYRLSAEANWNVNTRLSLAATAGYNTTQNTLAWVSNEAFRKVNGTWQIGNNPDLYVDDLTAADYTNFDDKGVLDAVTKVLPLYNTATKTYYTAIFGYRDRQSADASLRMNLTFTPKISFQLYSQLLAGRGQYTNLKVLQDQETLLDFPAYPKRHDFSLQSFQSNAVFRWEYRPGSVIYLVWSQGRSDQLFEREFRPNFTSPYAQSTNDQISNTFDQNLIYPSNTLIVKFNYMFLR